MKAYVDQLGIHWYAYIQTPRGTWVRLEQWGDSQGEVETWLADCGFVVVTKEQSFGTGATH